jgi:hypothetical protein
MEKFLQLKFPFPFLFIPFHSIPQNRKMDAFAADSCALTMEEVDSIFENVHYELPKQEFQETLPETLPIPRYTAVSVVRGSTEDTYFGEPLYKSMLPNKTVIDTITFGSREQILHLPNFSNPCPGTKAKSDLSLECKFHVDVTAHLMIVNEIIDPVEIYQRMALLSDRMCLGCKNISAKVSCMCGKWRCNHCIHHGRDVSFADGIGQWMASGCPSRHTIQITN